jgi:hypothetical protein
MVGLRLIDVSVSLKYEVDEARAMGMKGEDLDDKEYLLNQLIYILKSAGVYILVTIVIMSLWLFQNSLVNKN